MPIARAVPKAPPPGVPVVDPETGQVNQAWYAFFQQLLALLAEIKAAIP